MQNIIFKIENHLIRLCDAAGHVKAMQITLASLLLIFVGLLAPAFAQNSDSEIPKKLSETLRQYEISLNDVTLLVQAMDEVTPRVALNLDIDRNPASLIKLITTWVALEVLGPNFTWETNLYAAKSAHRGNIVGNIILKGDGDPYFLNRDLWTLLGELKNSGISQITGDLLIDETKFLVDETDPYLFDGDGRHIYNALPKAFVLNFNSIELKFTVDQAGKVILLTTKPSMPDLNLINNIGVIQKPCIGDMPKIKLSLVNANEYLISGVMPTSCDEYKIYRDLIPHHLYVKNMFEKYWAQWGGTFSGSVGFGEVGTEHELLASFKSRPLGELVRVTNKWSNNLMARMLVYSLAGDIGEPPYTRSSGLKVIMRELRKNNLDTSNLAIDNGSGLSRDTKLTGRFLFQFLKNAWGKPYMPEFVSSMSIAGVDGTARKRFQHPSQIGVMHLKTGSLEDVSAIAGYIHKKNGKTFVVFSIINSPNVNDGIGKKFESALLDWTADNL